MITINNYTRVKSLEEAYELNQKRANRIVGGMLWMKMGHGMVNTAIDLCDLGLDTIEETDDAFLIGAMTSLRQLETNTALNTYSCGAVANALKDIVGVQFRNVATIGGTIWGRFGFSDVLTVLLSMDAYVELYKAGVVPLEQFIKMERDNDIIVRIVIKKTPGKFVYQAMRAQRTDFPILTCAVSQLNGEYRTVIGARPARAEVYRDEKQILQNGLSAEAVTAFSQYVAEVAHTAKNMRGSAQYRTHLVQVLTQRSYETLGGLL